MIVSRLNLTRLAALVWYGGGIALLMKSFALFQQAYLMTPSSPRTVTAALLGLLLGLIKGKYLFLKSVRKNVLRISQLSRPRIWQFVKPGMLIFLAIIIPTGATLSHLATGHFTFLCWVGALDLSIAVALLFSSFGYWEKGSLFGSCDDPELAD